MAKVASFSVGARQPMAAVQATLEQSLGERFDATAAIRLTSPRISVEVEPDSERDGFDYFVRVFALSNPEAQDGARYVREVLEQKTPWRFASKFDVDDKPTDERPALTRT